MPAKNRRKEYLSNSYYHIYNRGVEKRLIFQDSQDYAVYLSYLKNYLLPKDTQALQAQLADKTVSSEEKDIIAKLLRMNNFSDEITLLAYCLMPNHFHLFIKQQTASSMDSFMNSLATRYTMYFNRKYNRVGSLYQGVYKAVRVTTDSQFITLSRYIHKQAIVSQGQALRKHAQPSSYLEYIGKRNTPWVHEEETLVYFSKENPSLSYESFVFHDTDISDISHIIIEDE